MSIFEDRVDAGRQLGRRLAELRGQDIVVLGLPRGGVPVAFEVAAALDARDRLDARTNPHEPTADAVVLDTSVLDRGETIAAALDVVRERAAELMP